MNNYHQNRCGCASKQGGQSGGTAFELGKNLGGLFFAATRIVAGGMQMMRSYYPMPQDHSGCRCSNRSCDCVECLPPVYAGCCRNCGE
jgi:hypothetical protein